MASKFKVGDRLTYKGTVYVVHEVSPKTGNLMVGIGATDRVALAAGEISGLL